MCSKRVLTPSPAATWEKSKGPIPLVRWQIDDLGLLPISEGYQYAMTCVDTATELLVAFPAHHADQQTTKRGPEHLFVAYGGTQVSESAQGTCFTGHMLQGWMQQLGIKWKFHVPYNPTRAGIIERYNGLLKSGLKSDTSSLQGWSICVWTILWHLNEKPQKGALSPSDMLTHLAASPIQLYVQTKEELLKSGYGQQSPISAPAASPNCMKPWRHC